jgi:hypothetical protein
MRFARHAHLIQVAILRVPLPVLRRIKQLATTGMNRNRLLVGGPLRYPLLAQFC